MENRETNYIDGHLAALERLRDILTPHGIQIINIHNASFEPVNFRSGLQEQGYADGVYPTFTVEIVMPQAEQVD